MSQANGTFDLAGLIKWGADRAIGHLEERAGFPMKDALVPLVEYGVKEWAIPEVLELNPLMIAIGKLAISSMERQKQIQESRRAYDNGSGES